MQVNDFYYGAHMSIKNGIISAIDEILEYNGNMIQIFISNPMSTKSESKINNSQCDQIRQKLLDTNSRLVIHLPYVINLSKPIIRLEDSWWIKMICDQLIISNKMNSIGCVVHVGKHLDLTIQEGIDNMYNALIFIINFINSNKLNTYLILETAAGQGTELITTKNNSIEDLSNFYNKFTLEQKKHLRICIDTCHIFAAGFDITNSNRVKTFFDDFHRLIGIKYIALIHLNDSKSNCGSCVDRHENLGYGKIGIEGLRNFIRYGAYYKIPIILETPSAFEKELQLINIVKNGVNKWSRKLIK